MLYTEENYNKYFSAVESKFYSISTWKLQKKSIKKQIFENIEKGEVELDEVILPYGYMPICLYFLLKGLAAKIYNEGTSNDKNSELGECVDEIMQCITDYYNKEYADVLKMVAEYQNPKYNYNIIETATFYFSTRIVKEFKMILSTDDFKLLMTDNVKKIFDDRSKDTDNIKKKYEQNFNKSSDPDSAEKLKFCIKDIENKIKEFNFNFFVVASRPKLSIVPANPLKKFNETLSTILLDSKTRFGTVFSSPILGDLLDLITANFMDTKEEKINLILSKLSKDLLNSTYIFDVFNEKRHISYLWIHIKNSITLENILSMWPPVLYKFFKEENRGIRDSYTGEYMDIFDHIYNTSSEPDKKKLIEILSKADYKFDLIHYN
jgi:hypothetical protein